MTRPQTIDMHAHILSEETVRTLQREVPAAGVSLTHTSEGFATLEVAGVPYKQFPRGGWDLETRLSDMDAYGFDRQVVAVCPQTLLYEADAGMALTAAQIQNDAIASLVRGNDRFFGLATAPMQAPESAAAELGRAMSAGLSGAMIGSNIDGRNLDDPALDPFWAEAESRKAFLLIHPMKVAGMDRQRAYYLQNFIGNPLDTTIAAACLVFGGVLERFPDLRICLSHGGGFVPYQAARWRHGWAERDEAKVRLKGEPGPSIDRLLYDTILHDAPPLQFLVDDAGARRVMLGSDYPFDMGQYDAVSVIDSLRLTTADRALVLGGAAETLLGEARHG